MQPELLNDQVIPPADQHTIDNLPTVSLGEEHLGKHTIDNQLTVSLGEEHLGKHTIDNLPTVSLG